MEYLVICFPVIGIGLLSAGLVYRRRLMLAVSAFGRTNGTICGCVPRAAQWSNGVGTVHHPVIEYKVGGMRYTATSAVGYGKIKEKEKTTVEIMYDPSQPAVSHVVKDYYAFPHMMIAVGVTTALLGTVIAYHTLK